MRYQWRLLLFRSYVWSHRPLLSHKVISDSTTRYFSSFLHERSRVGDLHRRQCLIALISPLASSISRSFSSEPAIEQKKRLDEAVVIDVFSRLNGKDEIRNKLDSNDIVISDELVLTVLRELESSPDVAGRFFQWVLEVNPRKLSFKSYNMMLRILGVNGLVDEFWELVDAMKKKGHGVSASVKYTVGEKFKNDGLEADLEKLEELFASGSVNNSVDKVCNRVCKIVMKAKINKWSGWWYVKVDVQLRDFRRQFRSDLVKMILEKLDVVPRKALLFFRSIAAAEYCNFEHDEKTYNAMARVLGKEKFFDTFRNIIRELRSAGYEMEMETYVRVSARFCRTKMIKEAVELFEFAMSGSNTPTPHCCSLLLKKIVSSKNLDMDLFSRTVKAYTRNGNVVPDSMLQQVLKSLRSVDRFGQSKEVLKAMNEAGYLPSSDLQSVIASGLSREGKKDEANDLVNFMEASGNNLDDKAMASLVEGHCDAKDLEEATKCFKKMISKEGVVSSYTGYEFEKLILAYCNNFKAREAYKLFKELVKQNQLKPWRSTYKIMVRNLLMKKVARDGGFEEALSLIPMMKKHGLPPFVDPFMDYLSNNETSSEAFGFMKAVNSKKFPSKSMVMRSPGRIRFDSGISDFGFSGLKVEDPFGNCKISVRVRSGSYRVKYGFGY